MPNASLALALRIAALLGFPHAPEDVVGSIVAYAHDEVELALGLTWAAHESYFQMVAVKDGGGMAYCFFQIHSEAPLSVEQCSARWYGLLRADTRFCGSVEGALRALSSGRCDRATSLVRERVDEALLALELAR